ncbi:MAG: hypothetical protein RL368_137 [Pseudomonadota bacterium]
MNNSFKSTPLKAQIASILMACALSSTPTVFAKGVTDADIANDATTTGDVVSYGMGLRAQRHSPLTKINKDTVKHLVPAWSFSFGDEKQRGQEAQPMVANGKIFVTASYSRLFAVDAKTGQELWQYDHRLPDGILPCCDVINRGAALYDNLVIFGTLDAQLVALDQDTGKVVWKEKADDYKAGHSYTAAPIIVNGKVITGIAGGEFGVIGRIEARDAKTGKLVWTRPVIEGHMGYMVDKDGNKKENGMTGDAAGKTWPGDMWKYGGGATWLGGTYDADTNLLFFGTGNPAPWNAHTRPGDNLYTASTLAISPDTGKIVWHYQTSPNDSWDFDGVNEFIPFDFEKDGKTIKAGAKADRNGFFYVLDRTNGKLLSASKFLPDLNWAEGIDLNTGRPIEKPGMRPGNPSEAKEGKKGTSVFTIPSFLGGKNWMPMAYSPKTGYFYVPSNDWGMDIWNEPITYKKGAAYLGAGFTIKPIHDDHIGVLRAMDPKTGKIVWEQKNVAPLWGGVLTTAGDLVFTGTPEGYLKAFDAQTGEELWKFQTGSGVVGVPVTWEQDGEQFVAVPSGWGGAVPLWGGDVAKKISHLNQGGSLWVFKLHAN